MQELGCTDLLDPYQNVIVAVDYLDEQINRYGGDLKKGLTAYNKGSYNGTITQYAKTVLAYAEKINNERSQ
jgi:soluble lytic murein transglycosylase-like protein